MNRLILEVAGRKVYWEIPPDTIVQMLQGTITIFGPADGNIEWDNEKVTP